MSMPIYFLFLIVILSGCAGSEERARQQEQYEMSECARIGFKLNTPGFGNCRLQLRAISEQERSRKIATFGAIQQMQMNRPKTCTPSGNGFTCY